ncbi:recombination regulator RecX [Leeia oryzae]|uniref:recombination regulator RecX n=1 Tax=Leeia oryzae TaxID=356662 RepID=UPI0003764D08|nr:recombination regulator RecX [Leeia oryzae]
MDKPNQRKMSLEARAINLLSRREYSRKELAQKLKPHAETPEELALVLDKLGDKNWLSDQRAAEQWVQSRASRYGDRYLKQLLQDKGIDKSTAMDALEHLETDERQRAIQVWEKKFNCLPQTPQEKLKQMRFMASRGFSARTIQQVLSMTEEELGGDETGTDD